mgnify:CR=1 FL=1
MIGNLTVIEYWNKAKEISSENHIQVEVPAIEELLDVIFNDLTITFAPLGNSVRGLPSDVTVPVLLMYSILFLFLILIKCYDTTTLHICFVSKF